MARKYISHASHVGGDAGKMSGFGVWKTEYGDKCNYLADISNNSCQLEFKEYTI